MWPVRPWLKADYQHLHRFEVSLKIQMLHYVVCSRKSTKKKVKIFDGRMQEIEKKHKEKSRHK